MAVLPDIPILSIRQPYAWAIVTGIKPVENRTWWTGHRGPTLIHAGVSWYDGKRSGLEDIEAWARHYGVEPPTEPFMGGIIGIADLVDCVRKHDSGWFNGPFGFVFANPRPLPFVPMRGKLGFFRAPKDCP